MDGEDERRVLRLDLRATDAIAAAVVSLENDERFEHLREPKTEVLAFIGYALANGAQDPVPDFVARESRSIDTRTCFVPIEQLVVIEPIAVLGLSLLPPTHEVVPDQDAWFMSDETIGSVAAVEVTGTHLARMADRARNRVARVLRVLRVTLQSHGSIGLVQLRFRLGEGYSFGNGLGGFSRRPDMAHSLGLDARLIRVADDAALAELVEPPLNDLQRAIDRALRWIERAWFEGDPIVSLLFLFYAVEAVLGDTAEGLKANSLAFRQALVGNLHQGGFTHPSETWWLYAQVRSVAVHGGEPTPVDRRTVESFGWAVRLMLEGVVAIARDQGLTRRVQLRRYLNSHDDADQLRDWLRAHAGPEWDAFFDEKSARRSQA